MQTWYKGANRSPTALSRRNHAIGHGVQTRYVAPAPRVGVEKTEISSTRGVLPTSRREFGVFCSFFSQTEKKFFKEKLSL